MKLAIFNTDDKNFSLMQTSWASAINPVLSSPLNNGLLLKGVPLATGVTVINHKLGRLLQGWQICDVNGAATIYRSAAKNDLTLTLTSSAAVTVDIFVF